ncbi:hypothetical protein [Hymenobacter sp. PAMC 26628]|uniref:hypothetical protein n=1 Tax=Hymenobacter sp. PAMC 26628 TaxID=1484118 RepID=UPI000770608A|nr:hypothetical protein [Hymenobacter sp. PAMC 26628]AMJ65653.1 hypothetical protein AXW84_09605 [Hymenobacter sp. PAMC 26628]
MSDTLPKTQARRRLAALWFGMAALPTLLLGYNTLQGRFDDPAAIWQWYSPFLFPTLLLIIGTLRASETAEAPAVSSTFYFRVCWGLSFFYGLCLWGALALGLQNQADSTRQLLDSLKLAGLLLTAVQSLVSLVSLALAGFFVAASPAVAPVRKAA